MDLTNTPTPTKIYYTENETPPQTQPLKPLSFTNGALKKHHHHPPPAGVVTYKECLKNHAASFGGHALDGCGEFMPSPNTTYPTSLKCAAATTLTLLKCAACGCHRNFHRREVNEFTTHSLDFHRHNPPTRRTSTPPPPPPPSNFSYAPDMLLALSTAVPDDQPAKTHHPVTTPATPKAENPSGRKRFRTKFSQEQKKKMFLFAEKLDWKMQKSDEEMVEEFCNEIGIRKVVLKVWIHNNKYTLCKRDTPTTPTTTTTATTSNGRVSFDNNGYSSNNNNGHHQNGSSGVHLHVSTNGSSSSS